MEEYTEEVKDEKIKSNELIKLLNESEQDVLNGRLKPIQETFEKLKKELK